jgi:hypothetical protein
MLPTVSMPAGHSERVPLCLSRLSCHLVSSPFAEPLRPPHFISDRIDKLSTYRCAPAKQVEPEHCLFECARLMLEVRCGPDMRKVPGHAWYAGDLEGGVRV